MLTWTMRGIAAMGLAVALTLGGCNRIQPIYTVENHPVPAAAQQADLAAIDKAIFDVATADGWMVDRIRSGVMRATEKWREHSATVEIVYSQTSYSIRYVGSSNLKAEDGSIHRRYNALVTKLEQDIEKRLYNLGS